MPVWVIWPSTEPKVQQKMTKVIILECDTWQNATPLCWSYSSKSSFSAWCVFRNTKWHEPIPDEVKTWNNLEHTFFTRWRHLWIQPQKRQNPWERGALITMLVLPVTFRFACEKDFNDSQEDRSRSLHEQKRPRDSCGMAARLGALILSTSLNEIVLRRMCCFLLINREEEIKLIQPKYVKTQNISSHDSQAPLISPWYHDSLHVWMRPGFTSSDSGCSKVEKSRVEIEVFGTVCGQPFFEEKHGLFAVILDSLD